MPKAPPTDLRRPRLDRRSGEKIFGRKKRHRHRAGKVAVAPLHAPPTVPLPKAVSGRERQQLSAVCSNADWSDDQNNGPLGMVRSRT